MVRETHVAPSPTAVMMMILVNGPKVHTYCHCLLSQGPVFNFIIIIISAAELCYTVKICNMCFFSAF